MTDPERVAHPERIAASLPAGFGVIYRHFGASDRFVVGARLARVCRSRRLVLLVSADPLLAMRIKADGVHWPEASLRGVRPAHPRWIETASAHSRASIARAKSLNVDAVFFSAVFESASPSAGAPCGAMRFGIMAGRSRFPVYALGGVTHANAARAMRHAAGWAAVEAVMSGWKD